MKRVILLTAVAVLLITVAAAAFITNALLTPKDQEFYVGVTYCGNTAEEAKLLIDKVKDYTNLFVLQSGILLHNSTAISEIGDYAVNAGMHYLVYFGTDSAWAMKIWRDSYDGHWNSNFLGVYFGDEPGGKMLDSERQFYDQNQGTISKYSDGRIQWNIKDDAQANYNRDGSIRLSDFPNGSITDGYTVDYYVNGTITLTTYKENSAPQRWKTIGNLSISDTPQFITTTVDVKDKSTLDYTYEELCNARPFQSYEETAQRFINASKSSLTNFGPVNFTYLTSDYGLYWFDYLAGYDTVLAQLGWNHTTTQDIALVRGAANLQNKSWGTIITWKYTQAPYLASGQEIYEQMRTSYECGAKYVVIFNYAEDMEGPYGTLRDEHFQALERFWRDVVQNPYVSHGNVKVEAAFVLPKNCGWGMRNQQDIVWGLWQPTEEYQQFWPRLQDALARHGQKLDIVYDDSAYPLAGKYSQIYYWNQTT